MSHRISIGILAWNEAGSIRKTIESVFQQTLLRDADKGTEHVQFAVVANGSTDGTAAIAREVGLRCAANVDPDRVTAEVQELPEPNRTAAWNEFVHRFSDRSADYLVLMDADIVLGHDEVLKNMIDALESDPHTFVAASKPVKDFTASGRAPLRNRLSRTMTGMTNAVGVRHLAGGLYAGRAEFLRRIHVPWGMCGDDGFLTQLAWTNLRTEPTDQTRVAVCGDAPFLFEPYLTLRDLYRNHRRRAVASVVHHVVFDYLDERVGQDEDPAEALRQAYEDDPNWMIRRLGAYLERHGLKGMRWRGTRARLTQLRYQRPLRAVVLAPMAVAFTLWACAIRVAAYRTIRQNKLRSLWLKQASPPPMATGHSASCS